MIRPKNLAGFSLLEALVVVAIIAIIALIGVPVYINLQPQLKLQAAARSLAADLRLAQEAAVTEQINYLVAFNTNENSYSLVNSQTGVTVKKIFLDKQVKISSVAGLSNNQAVFNSSGALSYGGTIILQNSNNQQKTITLQPSGYVQIH